MQIAPCDLSQFEENGYFICPDVFSAEEVAAIYKETNVLASNSAKGLVYESDNTTLRSINGSHFTSDIMKKLACLPRLLNTVQQLLNDKIYIHQYKINMKNAFIGDVWEWHSDFWFWHKEDGMPQANALTAAIFLDDVNEFNGPMFIVPKSHKALLSDKLHSKPYGELNGGENWKITTSSQLKYHLSEDYLSNIINAHGIISARCSKGSILFFHSNLLHCSSANTSPWNRRTVLISYNSISNTLQEVSSPRPLFLAERNFTPIKPFQGDIFNG